MNKASDRDDGIPAELFQTLKDDAVKVLHSICQQIWKTLQWSQNWEMSVFIPVPKKGNAKEYSNYHTIALISHANKVMLKILKLASTVCEPRTSRCSCWIYKRQRAWRSYCQCPLDHKKASKFLKNIYFCFIDYAKAFDCGSQQTVENSKEVGIPDHLTCLLRNLVCRSRSNG